MPGDDASLSPLGWAVPLSRLLAAAAELGLDLTPEQARQFERYRDSLLAWNQRLNLTAIRNPEEVEIRHFVDSLACLQAPIAAGATLLDVGSGGGLPGLPLKIARPDLQVTLLEATRKKARVLEEMASELGMPVQVVALRAEEFTGREQFDVVVARALAALPSLLELTLPFCRLGGVVLAMKKGAGLEREIRSCSRALRILGGELEEPVQYELDGEARQLVVVRKRSVTPAGYPRRPGVPVKSPLT